MATAKQLNPGFLVRRTRLEPKWKIGSTKDGKVVRAGQGCRVERCLVEHRGELLGKLLAGLDTGGRPFIVEALLLPQEVAPMQTVVVETTATDRIFYARRGMRPGLFRFVAERQTEDCGFGVLILKAATVTPPYHEAVTEALERRVSEEPHLRRRLSRQSEVGFWGDVLGIKPENVAPEACYTLYQAYVGNRPEPFPWDGAAFGRAGMTPMTPMPLLAARAFWAKHAFCDVREARCFVCAETAHVLHGDVALCNRCKAGVIHVDGRVRLRRTNVPGWDTLRLPVVPNPVPWLDGSLEWLTDAECDRAFNADPTAFTAAAETETGAKLDPKIWRCEQ